MPERQLRKEIWINTLRVCLPIALLSVLVCVFLAQLSAQQSRTQFKEKLALLSDSIQIRMVGLLHEPLSDVTFLRSMPALQAYVDSPTEKNNHALAMYLLGFSRSREVYDQVRYIDADGLEQIRIDLDAQGNARMIPKAELQNKRHRYYFTNTAQLSDGECYVSPLDLNVERGDIERPFKPMIRFGMPIRNQAGQLQGIILLNYLAGEVLSSFDQAVQKSSNDVFLLNHEGYYLYGGALNQRWGFMFPARSQYTLQKQDSALWTCITQNSEGKFLSAKGDFCVFSAVTPFQRLPQLATKWGKKVQGGRNDLVMYLLCRLSQKEMSEKIQKLQTTIYLVAVLINLALLVLIFLLVRHRLVRRLLSRQRREGEDSLRRQEAAIASDIQDVLLVDEIPETLVGLTMARVSSPARDVGGDFLAFWSQHGCLDVLIGDVMGKGVPGALLAAALKIRFTNARILESAAEGELPTIEAILHDSHKTITPILIGFERYATLNYFRIDPQTKRALWINCGHAELLHCRTGEETIRHIPGRNMPLGFTQESAFYRQEASVASGDVLVLYSDGITEATNSESEFYGQERLMDVIASHRSESAETILDEILRDVEDFIRPASRRDDLTCVVICVE
ncbi:MAG: SpoIIE family protein phosphatase [Phycisphaerales bacterium]|nr:SpoIIE family protein phosphatase [Phycisphaerales bacterium]